MSTDKELGEAWFGCQAEVKHLKAVVKLKKPHILTLKEYIRTLKIKEIKRQQREKKKDAEKKEVKKEEKTLIYDNMVGDMISYVLNVNDILKHCNKVLLNHGIQVFIFL